MFWMCGTSVWERAVALFKVLDILKLLVFWNLKELLSAERVLFLRVLMFLIVVGLNPKELPCYGWLDPEGNSLILLAWSRRKFPDIVGLIPKEIPWYCWLDPEGTSIECWELGAQGSGRAFNSVRDSFDVAQTITGGLCLSKQNGWNSHRSESSQQTKEWDLLNAVSFVTSCYGSLPKGEEGPVAISFLFSSPSLLYLASSSRRCTRSPNCFL